MFGKDEIDRVYFNKEIIWERYIPPVFDESRIAVVELDEMLNPTDEIIYYKTTVDARNYLRSYDGPKQYGVYIGKNMGITELATSSFSSAKGLYSVVIPEGVITIGNSSFKDCVNLKKVDMPEGLININITAFNNCTSLETIDIPKSVTTIGQSAFKDCINLEHVNIFDGRENNIEKISNGAFANTAIQHVRLNSNGVILGYEVFKGSSIRTAIINRASSVDYAIFQNCYDLASVYFDGEEIGSSMFDECSSLVNVSLGEHIEQIHASAFRKCIKLESVIFPDKTYEYYQYLFRYCDNMREVTIGKGATHINQNAFTDVPNLESILVFADPEILKGSPWGAKSKDIVTWH